MNDWRNSIGTGPFILKNYHVGVLMNLERNTSYWRENQIGPGKGDRLPYVDSVNINVIASTDARIAAFRRGELDIITLDGRDARRDATASTCAGVATGGGRFFLRTR